MSQEPTPRSLTLTDIARRCKRETELFFRRQHHDPRYCFELLRRAILDRNEQAWGLAYVQYRPLVAGWVERHSAFPAGDEEVQYFVNRAFEKMWGALTPAKFSRFPDLKSLLRYLQMCVHSVIVDHVRSAEQRAVQLEDEALAAGSEAQDAIVEDQVLDRMYRQEFWTQINARLHDEKERRVVYGSFVLALKPRELYAQSRDLFRDVHEVYRVKENVLARLRRDAELEGILSPPLSSTPTGGCAGHCV